MKLYEEKGTEQNGGLKNTLLNILVVIYILVYTLLFNNNQHIIQWYIYSKSLNSRSSPTVDITTFHIGRWILPSHGFGVILTVLIWI